jgi:hypothetical protein
MTGKDRPPGGDSRGPEDQRSGGRSFAMVTPGKVNHPLAPNPCWDGHPLAAAEHRRQMRMAAIALDRLLDVGKHDPAGHPGFVCPGMFGPGGRWVPCCRGDAA